MNDLVVARVQAVFDHVERRLEDRIPVPDLAGLAHLSAAHFSRSFKKVSGMSPARYIGWRRIERAKLLMAGTQDSLARIAAECGYADQSHFTRAFRRSMRVSPARWRRLNRPGGSSSDSPIPRFNGYPCQCRGWPDT